MSQPGLLGDAPGRDYAAKLEAFARFAEPELHSVVDRLPLSPGQRVLDAGCGAGIVTGWLAERVGSDRNVVAVDLSRAHLAAAWKSAAGAFRIQGDLLALPIASASVDLVWTSNTINHFTDPQRGLSALLGVLRPEGLLVVVQSAFLADMVFAWDARLEAEVTRACRQYYRDKYGLSEQDTSAARNILGLMQQAGITDRTARTTVIERTQPLSSQDETYLLEVVFRGHWGKRLRPYLAPEDYRALQALCDPQSSAFCLRRPDFHYLQTLTVITGRVGGRASASDHGGE